jgi:hypothetical protein
MTKSKLVEDSLPGIRAIALYRYGADDPATLRRARHAIKRGSIPARKILSRWESRKSWIDAILEVPDNLTQEAAE